MTYGSMFLNDSTKCCPTLKQSVNFKLNIEAVFSFLKFYDSLDVFLLVSSFIKTPTEIE